MCDVIRHPEWDQCRQIVEEELARSKADLAPLESEEMHVGERVADGDWLDVTSAMIAAHRRTIERLETLLAAFQAEA